jgi:hypothetical protein
MQRLIHAFAYTALISSLTACVVTPPPRASAPASPRAGAREVAADRWRQINERIDNLGHRVDTRVNAGFYPPPQGDALHRRLDVIRQEARDMATQHGGGLSPDEQHVLNRELDGTARIIGE